MTQWWTLRSEREQTLVISLVVIIAAFLLYFAVIRPVLSFREQALDDYKAASEVRDDVQSAASALSKGSGQQGIRDRQGDLHPSNGTSSRHLHGSAYGS